MTRRGPDTNAAAFLGAELRRARLGESRNRGTPADTPTWFQDWLEAEGEAQSLRIWSPTVVPGLLQTAGYARALFPAGTPAQGTGTYQKSRE